MSHKTLEAYSIPIPPRLAGLLKQMLGRSGTGFDEAALLQQIHYWALNSETTGWIIDGIKWIYNSLKAWQQQFPWMSEYGLRKAISNLKKLGLIQTAQHWVTSYRRVMFYRIDYEQLVSFAEDLCDLITPRCVNRDQVEASIDRTTDTETSSKTFSEQQTVVAQTDQSLKDTDDVEETECASEPDREGASSQAETPPPPSSGKHREIQPALFPELIDAVAQAISLSPGYRLPSSLVRAISQFPDQVKPAISYLHHQQKRRAIQNPAGYLYQAISEGWTLPAPHALPSSLPTGFHAWFDWAKATNLVIAATDIRGVHHTLHAEHGWFPTELLMQQYPAVE
ncbi:hypothetical protein H6F51_10440 [Cyanobacteria bacterium FACHB-DQ100]|nr:hypothetical protein [Cyanobacteria bacterium FACHB-DQ100]